MANVSDSIHNAIVHCNMDTAKSTVSPPIRLTSSVWYEQFTICDHISILCSCSSATDHQRAGLGFHPTPLRCNTVIRMTSSSIKVWPVEYLAKVTLSLCGASMHRLSYRYSLVSSNWSQATFRPCSSLLRQSHNCFAHVESGAPKFFGDYHSKWRWLLTTILPSRGRSSHAHRSPVVGQR